MHQIDKSHAPRKCTPDFIVIKGYKRVLLCSQYMFSVRAIDPRSLLCHIVYIGKFIMKLQQQNVNNNMAFIYRAITLTLIIGGIVFAQIYSCRQKYIFE